ncbi:hypothetical protein L9F63_020945, partial [Diploptera punctata]
MTSCAKTSLTLSMGYLATVRDHSLISQLTKELTISTVSYVVFKIFVFIFMCTFILLVLSISFRSKHHCISYIT